jgi:hypothetical protein
LKPEELDKMIEILIFVASKDGILSNEESAIIDVVKKNVEEFKKAYHAAWEDNILTEGEKENLRTLWKNIMLETTKTAIKDQRYTKDELSLVFRIFSTLIKHLE